MDTLKKELLVAEEERMKLKCSDNIINYKSMRTDDDKAKKDGSVGQSNSSDRRINIEGRTKKKNGVMTRGMDSNASCKEGAASRSIDKNTDSKDSKGYSSIRNRSTDSKVDDTTIRRTHKSFLQQKLKKMYRVIVMLQ